MWILHILKVPKKAATQAAANIILLKQPNAKEFNKEHIFAKIGMVIGKRVLLIAGPYARNTHTNHAKMSIKMGYILWKEI